MSELEKYQRTYNNLYERYQKLLAFVKECAEGEEYLNALRLKYLIPTGLDNISMKASELLKQIGERK